MKKIIFWIALITICQSGFAQQLSVNWVQRVGNYGWDLLNDIEAFNGYYYLGGSLNGNLLSDSSQVGLLNSNNAWLLKSDTLGNIIWQKYFGGSDFDNITSIASSNQGILIAGTFQDTLHYSSFNLPCLSFSGGYFGSINDYGDPIWLRQISGSAKIDNLLITSNNQGDIFLSGSFTDSIFLANEWRSKYGEKGIFLTQIQNEGIEILPMVIKGTGFISLNGLSCNDSLVCISGTYSDTLIFNDTAIISYGMKDVFVALFNKNNELHWVRSIGGSGVTNVSSLTIAANNEVGITGDFENAAIFNGSILYSQGAKDIYISIFLPDGQLKWLKSIGSTLNDYGFSITAGHSNDYFISGSYGKIIHFDGVGGGSDLESFSPFGNSFIAKHDNLGNLKACYNLPGSSEDYCRKILIEGGSKITTIGNFYGTFMIPELNLDTIFVASIGEKDSFILQFSDLCDDFIVDAGNDTTICPNSSIILQSSEPSLSYQWLPGGNLDSDLEITVPGTYTLLIENQYGCISIDSLIVSSHDYPQVNAGNDTIIPNINMYNSQSAYVSNSNTSHWDSSGDGSFDDPYQINTNYSMSVNDISNGSVTLYLTATNVCGSVCDSIKVSIPIESDGINVYPNPTSGQVSLVSHQGTIIQSAFIMTQSGNILEGPININGISMQHDLSNYPPGTYLYQLTTNLGVATKQVEKN